MRASTHMEVSARRARTPRLRPCAHAWRFAPVVSLLAIGVAAGKLAAASTSEAWAAFEKEVVSACTKASGLADARPAGRAVDFDDSVGYTALLVAGRFPQPHMHGKETRVLCLFDRRTRKPAIADAEALRVD